MYFNSVELCTNNIKVALINKLFHLLHWNCDKFKIFINTKAINR